MKTVRREQSTVTRYIAFCRIVEQGSFTRAAEILGYTQSAVSQMIRSLEKELSLTLFIRGRKEITLTREGRQLYPLIQKYVSAHRELCDRVGEISGLTAGEVRIGTFSSMSQRLLPGVMNDFSEAYPGIRIVLSPGDNTTLPGQIRSGMIDFGFVYPAAATGLQSIPIVEDDYLAVFAEGHPYGDLPSVSLATMAREALILVEEGGVNTVLSAFESASLTPNVMYRIHDDHTILSMVEQGIGVSILPAMILDRASYRLKTVPIETPVRRTVSVAFQDESLLPIAAKRFISFLCKNIDRYLPPQYLASQRRGVTTMHKK